jgi:hypothetical protein
MVKPGICIMAKTSRTHPEEERICNLVPTPESSTKTDWQFADALDAGVLGAPARLAASLDLRKPWGVGDQGSTGSCVGWASTDGVARYMFVTAGAGRSQPKRV